MARPLRLEYPGAWYHVMNRGAGRRWIFKSSEHYQYFLGLLSIVSERYHAEIHAYCLMGNHYHLLIRTPEANLQRIMRHINGVYTQYFNRSERRDGALFRGRYKAILVEADAYWVELSRYIHRNPIEAGIVNKLEEYRWSSYPAYIGQSSIPPWLMTAEILGHNGPTRETSTWYGNFVQLGVNREIRQYYSSKDVSSILGSKRFVQSALEGVFEQTEIPEPRQHRRRPESHEILGRTAEHYNISIAELKQSVRGKGVKHPGRGVAMYLLFEVGGLTLLEIAQQFNLSRPDSAGASIRNIRCRIEQDYKLRDEINRILQDLTPLCRNTLQT